MNTSRRRFLAIAALVPAGLSAQPGFPDTGSRIAALAARIERQPDDFQARLERARWEVRWYRETGDGAKLSAARRTLAEFARQFPDHFAARKLEVEILLLEERFAEAEPLALKLNREVPDDRDCYGYLADLAVRRGDYAEAERQVQWMLNLRKDEIPGRWKAIELREAFGEIDGALQLLGDVLLRLPSGDAFERARLLALGARIARDAGRAGLAGQYEAQQRGLFPALVELRGPETEAWRRAAEQLRAGDVKAALAFMEQSPRRDIPSRLFYAEALAAAGRRSEARAQIAIVRQIGYQGVRVKELEAKTK